MRFCFCQAYDLKGLATFFWWVPFHFCFTKACFQLRAHKGWFLQQKYHFQANTDFESKTRLACTMEYLRLSLTYSKCWNWLKIRSQQFSIRWYLVIYSQVWYLDEQCFLIANTWPHQQSVAQFWQRYPDWVSFFHQCHFYSNMIRDSPLDSIQWWCSNAICSCKYHSTW